MTTATMKALERSNAIVASAHDRFLHMKAAGTSGLIDLNPTGGFAQLNQFQDQAANRQRYSLFRGHVYSAVHAIAMEAAGQPVHVGRQAKKGEKERKPGGRKDHWVRSRMTISARSKSARSEMEVIDDHALLEDLEYPNRIQTRWQFVYSYIANLCLTGWAFIVAGPKKGEGGGFEFYSVPTTWVVPIHEKGAFTEFKIFNPRDPSAGSNAKPIPGNQVGFAYLPNPADPMSALAPAAAQMPAVKIDDYIQSSQQVFFENGIFPSVIVKVGANPHPDLPGGVRPRLTAVQRRQVYAAIKKVSGGIANYGNPAIVDGLIESIERLSMTQNEIGWEKSEKAVRSRILSAFGVHPFILGEEMAGSYAQAYIVQDRFFKRVNTFLDLLSVVMSGFVGEDELITEKDLMIWWDECKAVDPSMERAAWDKARDRDDVTQNEYRAQILSLPPDEDEQEAIINKGVIPHVAKIAADATAGAITPEQALALLTGLGLPEDVAKEIAGEGPPEPDPNAMPAVPGAVPGVPGQPPQAPGKPPAKPVVAQAVGAVPKPAKPKKPPKPEEVLDEATKSLNFAMLQLAIQPAEMLRGLVEASSLVDEKSFCPTGQGGGVDPSCGGEGGSGGSTGGYWQHALSDDLPGAGISVAPSGQIKLKAPKTAEQATKQLASMSKLLDGALADAKKAEGYKPNSKEKVDAMLIAAHAQQQMSRAMGYARKIAIAKKSVESDLLQLVEKLSEKYGLDPIESDEDPILDI